MLRSSSPLERVDKPYDVIALESRNVTNQKLLAHVNSQNEYLSMRNRDLEAQLESTIVAESSIRRRAADTELEKVHLSENLKDVDRMAKKLQIDKETVIEVADRELYEAKEELSKSRTELEKQDMDLCKLRADVTRLSQDNKHLTNTLTSQTNDMSKLESLVDKLQDDKRKLSIRVNKLITTEKDLVGEIDKLRRRKGSVKADAKRNRSPNRFDQFIKNLEQDRDYWKSEVNTLQQVLKYRRIGESSGSPGRSPVRSRSGFRSRSPSPVKASAVKEGRLESALRSTQEERDYYKREFELQRSLRTRPSNKLGPADAPATPNSELRRVIRERDELQTLLDKFERHMAEIQTNVKVLTGERDRLSDLYEEAKEELQRARHEFVRKTPTKASPGLAATHILKRVEEERDDALVDLRRTIVERDSLRERLKISTDNQIADKAHLEQQIEDLNGRLRVMHNDKNQLEMHVSGMKSQIAKLEEEVRVQTAKYNDMSDQCDQHKTAINKLRLMGEEREQTVSDCQKRILAKEDEIQSLSSRCRDVEDRLSISDKQCIELRQEIEQLRSHLSAVGHEKDNLSVQLSERSERCHRQDLDRQQMEDKLNQLHNHNRDLAHKLSNTEESLRRREKDVSNLKMKLDQTNMQVEDLNHSKNNTLRESRLLEEDLAALSDENNRLNVDLTELLDERRQLSAQVQDYVSEVRRVEEVLSQKEDERSRLLEQYRTLSTEAERSQTTNAQLEADRSSLRSELSAKDGQNRKLQEKIEMLDRECQQNVLAQQAVEGQLHKSDKMVGALEDRICAAEQEKHHMKESIAELRESNASTEHSRDAAERQLASKEMELEKYRCTTAEMEREINMLKDRCNGDRQRLTSLEQVLASNRDKEFQSQLAMQESASEVQLMKDRLTLNESKIDSQTREIGQLRNRITELEADLERARRQVTNERFEKERCAQELRRYNERSGAVTPQALRSGYVTPGATTPSPNRLASSSGYHSPSRHSRTLTGSSLAPAALTALNTSPVNGMDSASLTEWIKQTERKVAEMSAKCDQLSSV